MKKYHFIIVLFFGFIASMQSQTNLQTKNFIIEADSCCNSFEPWFSNFLWKDTIDINKLSSPIGIIAFPKSCKKFATFNVLSFEVSINDERKRAFIGPYYSFPNKLEIGSKIVISNCKVECKLIDSNPKIVILKEKTFFIK